MASVRLKMPLLLVAVISAVWCTACCGSTAATLDSASIPVNIVRSDKQIKLPDSDAFETLVINQWSDGDTRYLVDFTKHKKGEETPAGRLIALSTNSGETFAAEIPVGDIFHEEASGGTLKANFINDRVALVAHINGDLLFSISRSGLSGWSEPTKINDSPRSVGYIGGIAAFDESRFTVVWQDTRAGDVKVFSAYTENGGKSWSFNSPVDGEFPGDAQDRPSLAVGANERLILTWSDWREKATLVDVRYAFSDDKGATWSKSKILNDDGLPVWQMNPQIVAIGTDIFVAFSDFREEGEDDDRDWNIYYTKSHDNGESWTENRRLNRIKPGRQASIRCSASVKGGIYCTFSSTEKTVFGGLMVTASPDFGETWTKETPITPVLPHKIYSEHSSVSFSNGKVIVAAPSYFINSRYEKLIVAESPSDSGSAVEKTHEKPLNPLRYSVGEVLFYDDFSGASADQWVPTRGSWRIENGNYRGILGFSSARPKSGNFKSLAKYSEPERYVLNGKFLFDPLYHETASIYIRVSGKDCLVVTNQFRRGVWLAYEEDVDRESENILDTSPWSQKPLTGTRISLKNNVWYRFELVVTPSQIDYYIDGKHMFSFANPPKSEAGSIGLGGHGTSPTHFDEIKISALVQ